MNATRHNQWPLLVLFVGSLLGPFAYVTGVIAGWIDWAIWSPIALSSALLAWSCAIWINRSAK